MPPLDNHERLGLWLGALAAGDGATVMAGLADDVEFVTPQPVGRNAIVPYYGTARGKAAVADVFALRDRLVETLELNLRDYAAAGSRGWAEVDTRERHRESGTEFAIAAAHHFELDDGGLIRRWRSFFDPGPQVAAFRAGLAAALIRAIWAGDAAMVRECLRVGADPNARDSASGLTPLLIASGCARPEVVRLLLAAGADPHVVDARCGASPLHKACQGGSEDVVGQLLDAGAFVDAGAGTTGHTPLMDALWFKFPAVVQVLLDRGAGLRVSTLYGFSMDQHIAYEEAVNIVGKDRFDAANTLIEQRRHSDGRRSAEQQLMSAVVARDPHRVRRLIAGGADLTARSPRLNGFNDGHMPLHVAARDGTAEIVAELLAAGAPINAIEPVFTATPLHKAVYNGHEDITRILVAEPGIDLDVQGGTNGYTALHDGIWHGFGGCARILIEAGARLDLLGHDGKTPLDLALEVFGSDHAITRLIRDRLA